MRVLITGGAGFVGRQFCHAMLEQGADVVCVDPVVPHTGGIDPENWPLFSPLDYGNFTFARQDCRDWFAANDDGFDVVFHLAAMVGGRMMIEYQPLAVAEDLAIDAMFWRWAERTKPGRSVYFSSSAAYPISLQRPDHYVFLKEDMIDFTGDIGMPDMTYGWAKLTGEYLARLAYEKHGLKSVCYRPFSGYGEDQDLTYPFPAITKRIIEDRDAEEVIVWGSGRQMRDFVHIEDCVRCVLQTMDKIDDGAAINISSGQYTSFAELAAMILKQDGRGHVPVKGMADKPEGVFARGGDRTLQDQLGFVPEIPLEEGIGRVIEYWRARI